MVKDIQRRLNRIDAKDKVHKTQEANSFLSVRVFAEECLCQNGGVCVDINGTCDCPTGYTGLYCQFGGYYMLTAYLSYQMSHYTFDQKLILQVSLLNITIVSSQK